MPTTWSVGVTGDFDGNGTSDLLWRDTAGDTSIWFLNGLQVTSSVVSATCRRTGTPNRQTLSNESAGYLDRCYLGSGPGRASKRDCLARAFPPMALSLSPQRWRIGLGRRASTAPPRVSDARPKLSATAPAWVASPLDAPASLLRAGRIGDVSMAALCDGCVKFDNGNVYYSHAKGAQAHANPDRTFGTGNEPLAR